MMAVSVHLVVHPDPSVAILPTAATVLSRYVVRIDAVFIAASVMAEVIALNESDKLGILISVRNVP